MRKVLCLAAVIFLFAVAGASYAQEYPTKPIRLIVPMGAGGGTDLIARSIVARIADGLGKAVVVENKPGGGGDIGIDQVAKAKPDGYTLLMASATYLVRAGMFKVPYNPIDDFAPVMQVAAAPYVIVVNASLPVKSMTELVAYAKANPGKINFGSQGNGSLVHLVGELLKARCGIDMVHIPYKGAGAAFTDLLANQVQLGILTIPSALPYTKSDKLRPLAVTSDKRVSALPDLPTMQEAGIENFVVGQWQGVLAPKDTPPEVVTRLNAEISKVLQQPGVAKQLADQGGEIVGSTSQQFEKHLKAEFEEWRNLIKNIGLRKQ